MNFRYSLILLLVVYSLAFAQEKDSLLIIPSDSLLISKADSLLEITPKPKSDIDTVIYSTASDSLIFFVKDKKMSIYGDGKIEYKQMQITSANIFIDFERNEIKATGEYPDSAKDKLINTPVLTEAGESYDGNKMTYNFKTGRGTMSAANTEIEGAYFTGEKIKKVDRQTYFIKNGIYTTCDESCPHYYIASSKMKMVQDEELVAEWIWLYFGDVPFPIPVPFGVFPIQSGRRSGIIAPFFGTDATYGPYFALSLFCAEQRERFCGSGRSDDLCMAELPISSTVGSLSLGPQLDFGAAVLNGVGGNLVGCVARAPFR
ncbi:MAG: putative LPS assembly protein LptD [Ignavibacteriaceae bacterium]